MTKLSISVIIPVYNEEKYIEQCLFSLGEQTLKPLEIIVVNDGSTDASHQLIYNLQFTIYNLLLLKQEHLGVARARNLGARKAKGEILVFVDGDMHFDRRYLEKIVEPIVKKKAVAAFTKEEYVANPENIWSQCWSINSYLPSNMHIDPAMPDKANNFRAILKKVFLKTRGYRNIGYGEDVTVLDQLPGVKANFAHGARCYHFNPSSLGEVFSSARWMGRGEGFKVNFRSILGFSGPNSLRKAVSGSLKRNKPHFFIFKLVFDLGIFLGILERRLLKIHLK